MTTNKNCVFLGTFEDKEYLPHLKGMFGDFSVWTVTEKIELLTHLEMYCVKRNATNVVSTNTTILGKLLALQGNIKNNPKLSDYAGSMFTYRGIDIIFIAPLKQLFTVPHGKFICQRFISKLTAPQNWREPTEFTWSIADPSTVESYYDQFSHAYAIAADIETFKHNLAIRCVGYTAIFILSDGHISTNTIVFPLDDLWALAWIRKFNQLPAPKIFQNGKYDNAYLLRYNAPVFNWIWDTAHLFHSYYSELPKDLAFLNAFFLRKVVYWKDLAETTDLHEYYRYNGLDTWATANVWINQMLQMPDWAKRNYILAFPLVYPCLLAEMTGIKRDMDRLVTARAIVDKEEGIATQSLRTMIGAPEFNPGSSQQVVKLMRAIGCKDAESSGEIIVSRMMLRHPLVGRILGKIPLIRGLRKLRSTYLRLDSDKEGNKDNGAKEFRGRILYNLNPHGTETGRLASTEHHFWIGLQIHNIPVGEPGEPSHTKTTICADDGFLLGECDLRQAESWDLAHISGDTNLIAAVTGPRDFHSVNASAFFGFSYESLYDDGRRKTKNKTIRDLSKRTNHGAGYNMGPPVLIDTMGLDKVWTAKGLLKLPFQNPEEITEYLLVRFHLTYIGIKGITRIRSEDVRRFMGLNKSEYKLYAPGTYYAKIAYEIGITSKITSRAFHHTEFNIRTGVDARKYIEQGDWTRYCFGRPESNKLDLNSYVAHSPQSLNSRTLNEEWMRIFYDIALPNPITFRLHAQVHDSVIFSYKVGSDSHALAVQRCMEIPVTVRDVHGTYRTFTVPTDLKIGYKYWSDL